MKCEAFKTSDLSNREKCGLDALGFTSSKVPVCIDHADDDYMQIVTLADPMPAHFVGSRVEPKKMSNECRIAFTSLQVCGGCGVRVATGVLGLCEKCAPEYGYTPEDIAKHDKPNTITLSSKHAGGVINENVTATDGTPIKIVDAPAVKLDAEHVGVQCERCKQMVPMCSVAMLHDQHKGICVGCWPQHSTNKAGFGSPIMINHSIESGQDGAAVAQAVRGQLDRWYDAMPAQHQAKEAEQLRLPLAESGPLDLIRQRAADWSRRSNKWHRILDTERRWTGRGVAYPTLIGALVALIVMLDALHILKVPFAQAWPAFATVLVALVGVRANAARVMLDAGKADEAWVSADRMCEHYKGIIAKIDSIERYLNAGYGAVGDMPGEAGRKADEMIEAALDESQRLEASARFGVPKLLQDTLNEVTR